MVFMVSQCSTLLVILVPSSARAASLTVASGTSETQETTTSATYTASDTSIASGSLPSGTYLVAWGAAAANSNNANLTNVRLVRGATEIAALSHESLAGTAANQGIARSGYWLGTLSGSEALAIEYNTSSNLSTAYIDSKFIKAIRLDTNLTADTDYFTSGSQESSSDEVANASTSGWTDVKTLTKTFSSFDTENYLVLASMEISPDSTSNDCSARLEVDGSPIMTSTIEGEDTADQQAYAVAKISSIGTGSKSVKLQGQSVGSATCDYRRSRIYIFRTSIFDQAVENYSSAESTLASATWTDKNSLNYTPNQSETVMMMGSRALGASATTCAVATRIDDGTTQYADTHSYSPNNATADYAIGMSAASKTVSSATTFKVQFQRVNSTCTVKIKESTLIIWSMQLRDPATYSQSAYRWFDDTTGSSGSWWNSSWLNRRKITFDNSQSSENLANFPVRVSLTSSTIDYSKTQNAGQDIRFIDSNGSTVLKHEIETWNESGTSEVWVKVSQIDSGSTTDHIWMYYNNVSASDGQDANNVWDTNYKIVQHLEETSACAVSFTDSTSNGNNGTCNGGGPAAFASGKVNGTRDFDGTDDFIDMADSASQDTTNGTYETWINLDVTGGFQFVLEKGQEDDDNYSIYINSSSNPVFFYRDTTASNRDITDTSTTLTAGTWYHIAVVLDDTNNTLGMYVNGALTTSRTENSTPMTATGGVRLGAEYFGGGITAHMNGKLDEVRISNAARSSEWMEANYKSQNNQMNSFGSEEINVDFNPLAATDNPYTLTADGEAFRLRLLLHVANNDLPTGSANFKLQVAQKSGTCDTGFSGESYADVSTSSGDIRFSDFSGEADGAAMMVDSDDPTHSSHTAIAQTHEEANNFTSTARVNRGEDGKWEFALVDFSAPNNTSYCFRVVKADGSAIATPGIVPEIATVAAGNTAPNNPTSLAQKKTDDSTLVTGAWVSDTSVKFTATASDPDASDTLQLCVEKDLLGTGFSNTEDACGTGVSYSGSGVTATVTISGITDASEYHWQARVRDAGGLYSSWVSYDVNAESARDFGTDTTAPTGGTVYDGTEAGVDKTFSDTSLSNLSANWSGFSFTVSGISKYEYSIGTSPGATDTKAWTDHGTNTSVTASGLTLQTSRPYYFNVRATDNAGNTTIRSSNGQLVAPSVSFSVSPASVTFNNLNTTNSFTDTETSTLTTSTNAYGGYVIRTYATDLLRSPGDFTISNFNGGSYASPDAWQSGDTGFGYTSSDTSIQGSNKFQSDPCPGGSALASPGCYAPFTQTGPGDIVADHTNNVTGSPITNESFTITLRATVAALQQATKYQTVLVYAITPVY